MHDMMTASELTAHEPVSGSRLTRLTVAGAVYLLILAVAAVMRFVALGDMPLSPSEASAALASWMLWQPEPAPYRVVSPAYFSLTSLITPVMGFTDAVVRAVPAILGLATVALGWLLRRQLGLKGMLLLAIFLSISPLNGVVARTAGGDAIAMFALMLLFVAWLRHREIGGQQWSFVGAAALGLGLTSSPLFYGGLLTIVTARLVQHWLGPPWPAAEKQATLAAANWRQPILFGVVIFVAASTLFLWHPAGLGAATALPVEWLSQFAFPSDGARLLDPLLAAGRYELMLFLPGALAIIWVMRQDHPLGAFSVYWIASVIGLTLLQQGQVNNSLLLTLPGYLLLAIFTNDILSPRIHQVVWLLAVGLVLAGGLILINIARYSRSVVYEPQQLANIWMAVLVFAISVIVIYYATTWNLKASSQGILLATFILFSIYYWGTAWWLGHEAANDPRERWVSQATDDEVYVLQGVVRDISRQVTGSDFDLEIFSTIDTPVLRWYLRDFKNLKFGSLLPANTRSPVLISRTESEPSLENDYVGADFGMTRDGWQPLTGRSETPLLDAFRWWFFHESKLRLNEERIILWWRADLAQE